jgi:hypothetical protein
MYVYTHTYVLGCYAKVVDHLAVQYVSVLGRYATDVDHFAI